MRVSCDETEQLAVANFVLRVVEMSSNVPPPIREALSSHPDLDATSRQHCGETETKYSSVDMPELAEDFDGGDVEVAATCETAERLHGARVDDMLGESEGVLLVVDGARFLVDRAASKQKRRMS